MGSNSKGGGDYPRFEWERALRRTVKPKMPMPRSLLYALGTYFSKDGVAQVSNAKLAVATGRSIRAVKKHLREAVKLGWLHVQTKGDGVTANTYRLNIPPTGAPGALVRAVHGAPGSISGAREAPGDVLGAPLAVHAVHPFNSNNTLQVLQGDKSSKGNVRDVVGRPTTESDRHLSESEKRNQMELEKQQNEEASAAEGRALIEQWAKELHIEREADESHSDFTRRVLRAKRQTP